jgi:hypothetical protein
MKKLIILMLLTTTVCAEKVQITHLRHDTVNNVHYIRFNLVDENNNVKFINRNPDIPDGYILITDSKMYDTLQVGKIYNIQLPKSITPNK